MARRTFVEHLSATRMSRPTKVERSRRGPIPASLGQRLQTSANTSMLLLIHPVGPSASLSPRASKATRPNAH
eukprot:759272-Pyramimonas_sp.AAC.1